MKTLTYFLSISLLFTIMACRNKSPKPQPVAPVKQLPPYTERGANTFGCLIDGEVFIPGKNAFSSYTTLQCEYQYVNGKYIFGLFGNNFLNDTLKNAVGIGGNSYSDFIKGDSTYSLQNQTANFPLKGAVGRAKSDSFWNDAYNYTTTHIYIGELRVGYFDLNKQIVSGTFWFDAIDTATGKIVHVTEGRFDTHFYR